MIDRLWVAAALAVVSGVASSAHGAVVAATPQGFALESTAIVAATPAKVFAALGQVPKWWDGAHSYSGVAANISVDMRAGGCWCEALSGGGSIEHMRIVQVRPGARLVARGGLGPLQGEGADGALTWALKAVPGGTELKQTYVVGGYMRQGGEVLASAVDAVMSAGFARLTRYIETGSPEAAKPR